MIKSIKHIITLCAVASILALSFIGCTQPTIPETKYTVTFNNNGHGTTPPNFTDVIHGSTITEPTALKESGFNFIGWYKDTELNTPWDFSKDKVTSNVTLYAKWTSWDKVENVTFDKHGEVDYNDKVTLRCATTDATIYYSFDNDIYQTCEPGLTVNIMGNTLKAYATKEGMTTSDTTTESYTFKKYTVTFDVNGIGKAPDPVSNLKKGDKVPKPSDIKINEHYTLNGWYKEDACITEWDFYKDTVSSNITLHANWIPWDKVENVTFDKQGEVDYNEEVTLRCATTDATIYYSFDNENYKTCKTGSTVNVTGNTLKAYATKEGMTTSDTTTEKYTFKTYTVTFMTNDQVTAPSKISDLKKGDKVARPNVTLPQNYMLDGWYTDQEFTKPWDFNKDTIKENITLYLKIRCDKAVGDIILNDGSYISYKEITDEQKPKAIAIVCGKNENNEVLGMGLKKPDSQLSWTKNQDLLFNNCIEDIACIPSLLDCYDPTQIPTFTGDIDGSDNWNVIKKFYEDKQQTIAKEDCTMFSWAEDYGTINNLPEVYKTGWYIPSICELWTNIYKNKEVLNNALNMLKGQGATIILEEWLLSSSQAKFNEIDFTRSAWSISLSGGRIHPSDKTIAVSTLAIRKF